MAATTLTIVAWTIIPTVLPEQARDLHIQPLRLQIGQGLRSFCLPTRNVTEEISWVSSGLLQYKLYQVV